MERIRFKPLVDKIFYIILAICVAAVLPFLIIGFFEPTVLFVVVPTALLVAYFIISPLFGYVELSATGVLVKFGFFVKRELKYGEIRRTEIVKKLYSDSMVSLKNAIEHVNIWYGSFAVISVSVTDNAGLVREIEQRRTRSAK